MLLADHLSQPIILDGGLATQLEVRGADLFGSLWSARLLRDRPELIRQVHLDYFAAGANVATTASYQATIAGFVAAGLTEFETTKLLKLSVMLAIDARDQFLGLAANDRTPERFRPLVAASIGPYGAYMANGAEYTGDYDLDENGLVEFHRQRWHILAETDADLLACETIPSFAEAKAYLRLLNETPNRSAWLSFSCRSGDSISDGTPIRECGAMIDECSQIAAVGVNCVSPNLVPQLLDELSSVTSKPLIVYPNSGEHYDPVRKTWAGNSNAVGFATQGLRWANQGASLVGGCCRTTPAHIQQLSEQLRHHRL